MPETRDLLPEFKQNNVSKRRRLARERNVSVKQRKNAYGPFLSSKKKVHVLYSDSVRKMKRRNVLSDAVVQCEAVLPPMLLISPLEVVIRWRLLD